MRPLAAGLMAIASAWGATAEAPPTVPTPAPRPGTTAPTADKVPPEQRWVFTPRAGRRDIFVDLEALKELQRKAEENRERTGPKLPGGGTGPGTEPADVLEIAKREAQRIEGMIVARRWDEAIQSCDTVTKQLEPYREGNDDLRKELERIQRFRAQAEEARIYQQAQAAFDALELKVEGILWSADGSMAIIAGEPRARRVNERVKDCVIINIEPSRVDFLFHFQFRRFEFQRYVGEDVKGGGKVSAKAAK